MITSLLLATAAAASPTYQFAEDIPRGLGYTVTFHLVTDGSGEVTECAESAVHELTPEAPRVDLVPSRAYVADACRKLSTRLWQPGPKFYFCRYLPDQPDKAFCESRFGH